MGKPESKRIICFCYSVTEEEIIKAIKEGAQSLMDIRKKTMANTGCGGCGEDVKRLLRDNFGKASS